MVDFIGVYDKLVPPKYCKKIIDFFEDNKDIQFRGRTKDSIEKQYYSTVKPMHEKFVQPSKSYSDIVIDGTALINQSINKIKSKLDLEIQ